MSGCAWLPGIRKEVQTNTADNVSLNYILPPKYKRKPPGEERKGKAKIETDRGRDRERKSEQRLQNNDSSL